MNINQVIEQLSRQGVAVTEQQILDLIGSTEHLAEEDILALAEMLSPSHVGSSSTTSSIPEVRLSRAVEAEDPGQMVGQMVGQIDPGNLPAVQSMSGREVGQWIEATLADPRSEQDDRLITFLCALYDQQEVLRQVAQAAAQRLTTQDEHLIEATQRLSGAVVKSLQGMQIANTYLAEIAGGADALGGQFRGRTSNLQLWLDQLTATANRSA